jgi:hypothetical protein
MNAKNADFTCVACINETPYCFYCDFGPQKLPILDNGSFTDKELAEADAFDKEVMFRCYRCEKNAHMSCLIHHYAKEFDGSIDADRKPPLGSVAYFSREWSCVDCTRWDNDIDTILTWRDVEVDAEKKVEDTEMPDAVVEEVNEEKTGDTEMPDAGTVVAAGEKTETAVVVAPVRKEREYLVKFQDMSHIHNTWVPEYWLHSIRRERAGLKRFLKKVKEEDSFASHRIFKAKKPDWPKSEAEVVDSEWIRVGKLLDVEFQDGSGVTNNITKKKKKRGIVPSDDVTLVIPPVSDLESVYVKWAGLPYDVATWEMYPAKEDDKNLEGKELVLAQRLRDEIAIAYKGYVRGLSIAVMAPRNETPTFVERKVQPVGLKGGTLKDYQMDGLK